MKDDDPIRRISKDVFHLLVKTNRIEHIEKDSLKTNIGKINGIIKEEVNNRFGKDSPISRLENYLAFDGIAQEQTLNLILNDVIGRVELEMENVVTVSTRAERKPGEAAITAYDDEDEGEGKKEREKEDDSPKPNSKDSNAFPLISMLILGGTLWCSFMHFVVKWCGCRLKPRKTTNRSVVEFLTNIFPLDRETTRYVLACIAHIGSCISILLGIIILVPYYSCQHYTGYGLTFDDILHDSFYKGMWCVFVAILFTYCFSREGWNPLLRLVNNRKWFEPNDPKAHGIAFLFFGVLFFLYVYGTFNYHVWNILVNDEHIHSGMLATGCYKKK